MIKVGIFFGGQSREREISFAGGRTVYDNLDKNIFEAIPIFVDSVGQFILLDWQYIYKGTIRDFYPPTSVIDVKENNFQLYVESISEQDRPKAAQTVGQILNPNQFSALFDIAFLALHGPFGEDGNIQGLLEWYQIPFTGSGILPSAIGISKLIQKSIMKSNGFITPQYSLITRDQWVGVEDKKSVFDYVKSNIGFPSVVKSSNQGSSIGVSVFVSEPTFEEWSLAINKSFFTLELKSDFWKNLDKDAQYQFIRDLVDIRSGIGLPVMLGTITLDSPQELLDQINIYFQQSSATLLLQNKDGEFNVIVEQFVKGEEFSCIVIQDQDGKPLALPPTQIVKNNDFFDYRSKYLPGMSRKITPINIDSVHIQNIRKECERLFDVLGCDVYARIDGFFAKDGTVILNDPNTTSGMLPSSFFFHQAAEIGLNPSQFLSYIIRTSLVQRKKTGKNIHFLQRLLDQLDKNLEDKNKNTTQKIKVAVVLGGYSSERHISVESGRNIFEKLSSSTKYEPTPVFLTGSDLSYQMYELPINIMLKDNADDIKEKVLNPKDKHPIIQEIINQTEFIRHKYAQDADFKVKEITLEQLTQKYDRVFIALHGRPGEDGNLQSKLDQYKVPYNGSGVESSSTTIDKFKTNSILRKAGFLVANHQLIQKTDWIKDKNELVTQIESQFQYPVIGKPSDDGCSSAVKKIKNRDQLLAFMAMMFRDQEEFLELESKILGLKYKEEFPQKNYFVIEDLISSNGATHFIEITGGMLTKINENGETIYQIFEPSEALASGEVLSLEEKFLAGEGQNITPSRFSKNIDTQKSISLEVRETLKKVAETLNVQGYCRIDAFVRIFENGKVETIIIEINSLPGMTPATCIFHQCAIAGLKPYQFIDSILDYGDKRVKLQLQKK